MNTDQQLKLQAFLDGELPETEARDVAAWVARDPGATDLLAELRNSRKALAEIQRLEPEQQTEVSPSTLARLRRLLVPASAVAALLIVATFAVRQSIPFGPSGGPASETALADSGTFTYHDYANGTTLVWLNYPAETEFAKNAVP